MIIVLLIFLKLSICQQNINSINANVYSDPKPGTWNVNYNSTWENQFSKNYTGSTSMYYFQNQSSYNLTNYTYNNVSGNVNVCVTVLDLQSYGYIDVNNPVTSNYAPWNKVTPENFCYEFIYYNISHPDFNNWIDKNLEAYIMYKKSMAVYRLENYTNTYTIPDECMGVLKAMYCFYQFPFCRDLGNFSWYEEGICQSWCSLYQIRCGDYAIPEICQTVGSNPKACAGFYAESMKIKISFMLLLLCILLYLN